MMPDEKPKKAEDMSKAELRARIESLEPQQEFRVSKGVYVYRQTDGSLTYFVRLHYLNDKHEYWNFESQLEAEAFYGSRMLEIERCRKQGIPWDPDKDKKRTQLAAQKAQGMTIAEFGEWWYTNVVVEKNPHTTQRKYREYLDNHIYPYFGNGTRAMRSISVLDLEAFGWAFKKKGNARTGAPLKVSTLHTVLRMLFGFFCMAKDTGVIEKNPFTKSITDIAGVKDDPERICFTPEEAAEFLRGVSQYEPEWRPLFLTLQRTAARTGEVLALKEEDLDFQQRKILIERHLAEGTVLPLTKTKRRRTIDMTKELSQELQRYLEQRKEEERIRGIRFTYLFGWEADRPIAMRTLQEVYNALRDFLKLPPANLYATRHTALAKLYRTTKDLPYTKRQAGHARIESTLRYEETMRRDDILVDCLDTPTDQAPIEVPESTVPQPTGSALLMAPPPPVIAETGVDLSETLRRYERDLIEEALKRTHGHRKAAAALLGISYDTLLARLRAVARWERQQMTDGGDEAELIAS